MDNSVAEYKKLRQFMLETEMPTIRTRRGLQKGIPYLALEFKLDDLFAWLDEEVYKHSKLSKIVMQEVDLMLNGDMTDEFGLYTSDDELHKAYQYSAIIGPHRLTTRNAPIILPDKSRCIESLYYLPPFEGEEPISYRLTHRSFDIKSAGYSDLLVVAWLIRLDAARNDIVSRVTHGSLYWNAFNVTVYVEDDSVVPIKGTARR